MNKKVINKKKERDSEKDVRSGKKDATENPDISAFSILSAIIIVGISIAGYVIYKSVVHIPDIPDLDLNAWWGHNTSEPQDTSIRPYKIVYSDAMELKLRGLFEMYRRSEKTESLKDSAWTYGVNSASLEKIYSYWVFKYDFRQRPKFLNQFKQFKTNIQGLDIHYIHVKPKVDKNLRVLPLLLLHGWPGSVREFYEAIPLLTTPRPGYDFVFEVIAPSIPGFIFSDAPARPGLSPHQIAIVMRNLMHRIGHKYYYIQGGDFGHAIGSNMATIFQYEVLGFHTNLPVNFAKNAAWTWLLGSIWPSYTAGEHIDKWYPLGAKIKYYFEEFGYMHLQSTKPDTIGIALQDSAMGLAAYILDRFLVFTDPSNKLSPDGGLDKYFSYDKLLDNIMLYWISGSITSAIRLYKECIIDSAIEQTLAQIPANVPTWGLRFKHELAHSPDFVLKWKYPNLVGTTNFDFGGHFAAFERPEEFSRDVFKAVKAFLNHKK